MVVKVKGLQGGSRPGAGRPFGVTQTEASNMAVRKARLQALLMAHAETESMSPSQVTAALGLLKKYQPDLSSVELKGDADAPLLITTRAL